MVSPVRRHVDLLERRQQALDRQREQRPSLEREQERGTTGGPDVRHGDLGHRRVDAAQRGDAADAAHDPLYGAGEAREAVAEDAGKARGEESRPGMDELGPAEQRQVEELQRRDAEVRRHEQAHAATGGAHAGAPNYELERGPDGGMYAVGGHVSIDVSPVPGDPEATVQKMRQVRRAALAPAEPSPQDRRVAARASAQEAKAQQALREEQSGQAPEPSASGRGSFSVMSLHAQRAYGLESSPGLIKAPE